MTTLRILLAGVLVGVLSSLSSPATAAPGSGPLANRGLAIPLPQRGSAAISDDSAPGVSAPDESASAPGREPASASGDSLVGLIDDILPSGAAGTEAGVASPEINAFNARPLGPIAAPSTTIAQATAAAQDDASQDGGLGAWIDPRAKEFARVVGALAVVIGLMLLFAALARRLGTRFAQPGRPSGVIEILARYPIGRGRRLVLIKLVRRVILVHETKAGMTLIADVSDPDEVAALLTRVEAGGARSKGPEFQAALEKMTAGEGDTASSNARAGRSRRGPVVETIDLTRTQSRRLSQLAANGGDSR